MAGKNFVVRFGVYDDKTQKRSSTWRVWVPYSKSAQKNDVYIASRALGKYQKVSLHESGDWRLAFLNEEIALSVPAIGKQTSSRIIQRWEKPKSVGPGVILAYRILILTSELSNFGTKDEKVTWIQSPGEDELTEFDIMFTEPGTKVTGWPAKKEMRTKLITKYVLPNKSTLWVLYRFEKINETLSKNLRRYRNLIPKSAGQYVKQKSPDKEGSIRIVAYGYEQDGSRYSIELAY